MTNAAIGIDLGSNKCVMGVVKKGGIDIVLNDASGRSTPVCTAFHAQERLIGNNVVQQAKRNPKNTIFFPTRFLGLNGTCTEQLEIEKRFVTHDVKVLENNKLQFHVKSMGKDLELNMEQIIAFYLKKIKVFYEQSGIVGKDMVISIPSYASNVERQALLDAAEIAGLKCLRVINESTAIVLNYGFFRKKDLDEKKERVVAFVDVGHCKSTVTIASFKKGEAKILVHNSDRNLGGRDFDYEVMKVVGGEFAKKYGDDPTKIPKCRMRIYEAAEKVRKTLSGDTEASMNVDYLLNEEDLHRKINREEWTTIVDPVVRKFNDLVTKTLGIGNINPDDVEFVELVGDTTRIPILQDNIKMLFKKTELQRTLNALEVVARGSALQCAMLTPNFSVQPFKLNDYNSLPVSVTYKFNEAEAKEKMYPNFFKVGQKFPMSQELTWGDKEGDLSVAINYGQDASGASLLLAGLPDTIAQYTVGKGKRKNADADGGSKTKLTVRVRNGIHQIPELEGVTMTESWTEIEKIPIKVPKPPAPKPAEAPKDDKAKTDGDAKADAPADGAEAKPEEKKDGDDKAAAEAAPAQEAPKEPEPATEQKYEEKVRQRSREYTVPFTTVCHAIPPDQRKQLGAIEAELWAADSVILDAKAARNDLEAYAYQMKGELEPYGSYEHYIAADLKDPYIAELQKTIDWIYDDGKDATLQELKDKLESLRKTGEPVRARAKFRGGIAEWIELWGKIKATKIEPRLAERKQEDGKPFQSEEQQKTIADKVGVLDAWFEEINKALEAPKDTDIAYTLEAVERRIELTRAEVQAIFDAPPPKPKEEKKPEAPKDGAAAENKEAAGADAAADGQPAGGDAEMKDEAKAAEDGAASPDQQQKPADGGDVEMDAGTDAPVDGQAPQ